MWRSLNDRPPDAISRRRPRPLYAGLIALALVCAHGAASDHAHAQVAGRTLTVAQSDPAKEARLRELKALYDKGLISKSVFLAEQRRILSGKPPLARDDVGSGAAASAGGLRPGDRWVYRYRDSRQRVPVTRSFEIAQAGAAAIVESISLEDGRRLSAEHRAGGYLHALAGLQFAPYYFSFARLGELRSVGELRVEGGGVCGVDVLPVEHTECVARAEFVGTEIVSVPAGHFGAHVIRVTVAQESTGRWGTRLQSIIDATFWLSPPVGRLVKATTRHHGDAPWSETMELVAFRARGRQAGGAR